MHDNCLALFERYAKPYFEPGMRVLEVGPRFFPSEFQQALGDPSIGWDTVDIDADPRLTYVTDEPYRFPIPDALYDVVLAANVLEHVPAVWRWIKELARVCRVGGLVITINPVNWRFHEWPVDCWRAYPEGMRALHDEAHLETLLSRAESTEGWRDRVNWHGLELVLKELLGRTHTGEPFIPLDTISIGRRDRP